MAGGVERVIAFVPIRRGFAFAVVEYGELLIDWGTSKSLRKTASLIRQYLPDVVAIREADQDAPLAEAITCTGVPVKRVATDSVEKEFSPVGARNEQLRAEALANQFSQLSDQLPTFTFWESEGERRAIFRAVALTVTVKVKTDSDE